MGRARQGRWVVSPVAVALVPVGIGLVGNLATSAVEVRAWWWAPATWGVTALLVVVAVVAQIHQSRAASFDRAAELDGAGGAADMAGAGPVGA